MRTGKHRSDNKNSKKEKSEAYDQSFSDLEGLQHEELSGVQNHEMSTAISSTDDDENEGVGDGNIGRSKKTILRK